MRIRWAARGRRAPATARRTRTERTGRRIPPGRAAGGPRRGRGGPGQKEGAGGPGGGARPRGGLRVPVLQSQPGAPRAAGRLSPGVACLPPLVLFVGSLFLLEVALAVFNVGSF